MDWQTKEYIDEKFNDQEDKLNLILSHLGINEEDDDTDDFLDEDNEETDEEEIDNGNGRTTEQPSAKSEGIF